MAASHRHGVDGAVSRPLALGLALLDDGPPRRRSRLPGTARACRGQAARTTAGPGLHTNRDDATTTDSRSRGRSCPRLPGSPASSWPDPVIVRRRPLVGRSDAGGLRKLDESYDLHDEFSDLLPEWGRVILCGFTAVSEVDRGVIGALDSAPASGCQPTRAEGRADANVCNVQSLTSGLVRGATAESCTVCTVHCLAPEPQALESCAAFSVQPAIPDTCATCA